MKNTAVSKPEINWELGSFSKPGPQFKFTENEHSTPLLMMIYLRAEIKKMKGVVKLSPENVFFKVCDLRGF